MHRGASVLCLYANIELFSNKIQTASKYQQNSLLNKAPALKGDIA